MTPPMTPDRFRDEVLAVVAQVPAGRVVTYGRLARLAGMPRHARLAGRIVASAPASLPCHRVVDASGRTAPGWSGQRALLEAEGIPLRPCGRVDLKRALWEALD